MRKETVNLVIIGHLDHGKSTLIGRLLLNTNSLPNGKLEESNRILKGLNKPIGLAFLVDQLKEEREQSRTIDTTQIHFKTAGRNYLLIDVPGHTEFIKNMLTGATMADAAVLIIDAHRGIKEQTRRHAYLIKLLGMQKVIVVINKMDLVRYNKKNFAEIKTGLLAFFENLGIAPAFIIPISAKEDKNITDRSSSMRWYKGPVLLDALNQLKLDKKIRENPLRFCIQDVLKINKKYCVLGKVISGCIKTGQKVTLMPSGDRTEVGLIKVFGRNKKMAYAGENVGVILKNFPAARRGQIIVETKNCPEPIYRFKSNVFWVYSKALELDKPFFLRFVAQETECLAENIEKSIDSTTLEILKKRTNKLKVNQAATIIFKTKKPLIIENFSYISELGRFVIERGNNLCGVGVVIDTNPGSSTKFCG
jgi:sulfate adenylyltransferase subunit 1